MREIKYRIPWINGDGSFSGFTYWGRIDHKSHSSSECFTSPGQWGGRRAKPDEQFTGLRDKNGKEIYEGDIVRWDINQSHPIGIVDYIDSFGGYDLKNIYDDYHVCNDWGRGEYEVVGNIHENPELLESAK
jgi:hypothetical protein